MDNDSALELSWIFGFTGHLQTNKGLIMDRSVFFQDNSLYIVDGVHVYEIMIRMDKNDDK